MKYLINLFPEKEKNATDKIIFFSFHYLRYILVITQFIAICVFFYRFKVDQDIVDLRDALVQKKSIVESTQSLLNEVKKIDKKMTNVKTILTGQEQTADMFTYLFANLTDDIVIERLSVKDSNVDLEGSSNNSDTVKTLFEKLKNEKRFATITLSSVNKTAEGYTFKLSMSKFK